MLLIFGKKEKRDNYIIQQKKHLKSDEELLLESTFANLCLMLEKSEGRVSAKILRGTFSGGVSVPLISSSEESRTIGLTPLDISGFLKNESIDFCRCILISGAEMDGGEGLLFRRGEIGAKMKMYLVR